MDNKGFIRKAGLWIFPIAVLALMCASWHFHASGIAGYTEKVEFPDFSLRQFLKGDYQAKVEKYFIRNLPGLSYQLYLKNDIYDMLNWGLFHAGDSGKILQGENGALFDRVYVARHYNQKQDKIIAEFAQKTAARLLRVKELLARRNVEMALVMAPSKVDAMPEATPFLWRLLHGGPPRSSSHVLGIYEEYFARDGIPFANCAALLDMPQMREMAFTERGIHWSMYAAGQCLSLVSRVLRRTGGAFPEIRVKGFKTSTRPAHEEEDLAYLLNLYPLYQRGRGIFYHAEFDELAEHGAVVLFGDSFSGQLADNLEISGYATGTQLRKFVNELPPKEKFQKALADANVLLITATSVKFMEEDAFWIADALARLLEPDDSSHAARP